MQPQAPQPPQYGYQPQQPPLQPPIKRKSPKKLLFGGLALAIVLALGIGTGAYYIMRKPGASGASAAKEKPSVTLYYSDGKTVLWQNGNPAVDKAPEANEAPYFVGAVRQELRDRFGEKYYEQGGWKVITSLDAGMQATAEQLVSASKDALARQKADNASTVLVDVPTGQIKALVGGLDYANPEYGQLNFATSPVQPGSSIQPFVHAALIDSKADLGPDSIVQDTQGPVPGYPCTDKSAPRPGNSGNCLWDYDFKYQGAIPLRKAMGGMRNVPAVNAMVTVGTDKTMAFINKLGAEGSYKCYNPGTDIFSATKDDESLCYQAAALGDGAWLSLAEEASIAATVANGGKKVPQTTIVSADLNGQPKLKAGQPKSTQVLKASTAYTVNDIMSDPEASFLPGSCEAAICTSGNNDYKFHRYEGWKFAVVPGVTNTNVGATMLSWSPRYVVATWVGEHTHAQSIAGSGERLTMPVTRGLMQAVHNGVEPVDWQKP